MPRGRAAQAWTRELHPVVGGDPSDVGRRLFHEGLLGSLGLGPQAFALSIDSMLVPTPVPKGPGRDAGRSSKFGERIRGAVDRDGAGSGRSARLAAGGWRRRRRPRRHPARRRGRPQRQLKKRRHSCAAHPHPRTRERFRHPRRTRSLRPRPRLQCRADFHAVEGDAKSGRRLKYASRRAVATRPTVFAASWRAAGITRTRAVIVRFALFGTTRPAELTLARRMRRKQGLAMVCALGFNTHGRLGATEPGQAKGALVRWCGPFANASLQALRVLAHHLTMRRRTPRARKGDGYRRKSKSRRAIERRENCHRGAKNGTNKVTRRCSTKGTENEKKRRNVG